MFKAGQITELQKCSEKWLDKVIRREQDGEKSDVQKMEKCFPVMKKEKAAVQVSNIFAWHVYIFFSQFIAFKAYCINSRLFQQTTT